MPTGIGMGTSPWLPWLTWKQAPKRWAKEMPVLVTLASGDSGRECPGVQSTFPRKMSLPCRESSLWIEGTGRRQDTLPCVFSVEKPCLQAVKRHSLALCSKGISGHRKCNLFAPCTSRFFFFLVVVTNFQVLFYQKMEFQDREVCPGLKMSPWQSPGAGALCFSFLSYNMWIIILSWMVSWHHQYYMKWNLEK